MGKPDISEVAAAKRRARSLSKEEFKEILTQNDPDAFHRRLIESLKGSLDKHNPDKSLSYSHLYTVEGEHGERYLYCSKKRDEYLELQSRSDYRTIRRDMQHISSMATEAAFNSLMG